MKYKLSNICDYVKTKIEVSKLDLNNYISTENMLPNKEGIKEATTLPSAKFTQEYCKNDVLVSNIRPYFKKIWFADKNGGCSNDVLVFRAKEDINPAFLYYVLSEDNFFDYSMSTSKGTKMPRGDKSAIMNYEIPKIDLKNQNKIVKILKYIDEKIKLNNNINNNLEQQIQEIFKSWFIDFKLFNNKPPREWKISTLEEVSIISAGRDKPKNISAIKTDICPYPIYSNGLSNEGLYGYTDKPQILDESVTVSARGTIGFVCLRHIPYVPIVRLITLVPKTEIISAKYLYLWLKQLNITGTGTTQQQLTVPNFQKTKILIPSKETISRFTITVEPLFKQIWAHQVENYKLSTIRDNLLPKLMYNELSIFHVDI